MQIIQTPINSKLYKEGVAIRKKLFFDTFENAQDLIHDAYENKSIHVIAIKSNIVIGTGRLTYINQKAIISQMTVSLESQKSGVGSAILNYLLNLIRVKNSNIEIQLSARTTAIPFYKKFGFTAKGEVFASKKTGVLHQIMTLAK